MRTFNPGDYLSSRPLPDLKLSEFAKEGLQRAAKGEVAPRLDMARYKPEEVPPNASLGELTKAVEAAETAIQNQMMRSANVELLRAHGTAAWRLANHDSLARVSSLTTAERQKREEIELLNRQRSYVQSASSAALRHDVSICRFS